MATEKKQVLQEALELPPVERAELVEQILASFDFPDRKAVDEAWAREAEDRIEAFEKGQIPSSPAKSVLDRVNRQRSP